MSIQFNECTLIDRKTFEEFIVGFESRYTPKQIQIMKNSFEVGALVETEDDCYLAEWCYDIGHKIGILENNIT